MPQAIAVEIAIPAGGTLYACTHLYVTRAADTPASTAFEPSIASDVSFDRSVGCVFWGNSPRGPQNFGTVRLVNASGLYDGYVGVSFRDRACIIKRGDTDAAYSTWTTVATLVVDSLELTERYADFVVKDKSALLERPLQSSLYPTTVTNQALRGQPRPITLGTCYQIPLRQPDVFGNGHFDVHEDEQWVGITQMLDQGAALIEGTAYRRSAKPGLYGMERLTAIGGAQCANVQGRFRILSTDLTDDFDNLAGWVETGGGIAGRDASISSGTLHMLNTAGGADLVLTSTTTLTATTSSGGDTPWTPAALSDLALWLDADDSATITVNSGKVEQWDDKSGNNRDFVQASDSLRPDYVTGAINGRAVARFEDNEVLRCGSYSLAEAFTMYAAFAREASSSGYQRLITVDEDGCVFFGMIDGEFATFFGGEGSGWLQTNVNAPATSISVKPDATVAGIVKPDDDSNSTIDAIPYLNGTAQDARYSNVKVNTGVNISSPISGVQHFLGDVCEIVITHSLLSTDDRQKLEGYLAHKWGAEGSLPGGHPYETDPPVIPGPPPTVIESDLFFYEFDVPTYTSGSATLATGLAAGNVERVINATGRYTGIFRAVDDFEPRIIAVDGSNCDLIIDNLRIRRVVLDDRLQDIVPYLATVKGPLLSGDLDSAAIAQIDTDTGYRYGFHASEPTQIADVLDQLATSIGGWWFIRRGGTLTFGRLLAPTGTASWFFDQTNIKRDTGVRITLDGAPGLSTVCLAKRNWQVLSEGDLVGSLNYVQLNTSDKDADVALSNSNYTYSATNVGSVRSTPGFYGERFYFEITATAIGAGEQHLIGVANSSATITTAPGADANAMAYRANGQSFTGGALTAYGTAWSANDVIQVAIDGRPAAMGANQLHFRVYFGRNGTWQNSSDPDTEADFLTFDGGVEGVAHLMTGGNAAETNTGVVNFGQSTFAHTPPADYLAVAWQRATLMADYRFKFDSTTALAGSYAHSDAARATTDSADNQREYAGGIPTLLARNADATAEANRWTGLYTVERFFYEFTALLDAGINADQVEPGDLIELTWPRFGLSAKKLRVVGVQGALMGREVTITAWG